MRIHEERNFCVACQIRQSFLWRPSLSKSLIYWSRIVRFYMIKLRRLLKLILLTRFVWFNASSLLPLLNMIHINQRCWENRNIFLNFHSWLSFLAIYHIWLLHFLFSKVKSYFTTCVFYKSIFILMNWLFRLLRNLQSLAEDWLVFLHLICLHLPCLYLLVDSVLKFIQLFMIVSILLVISSFISFRLPCEVLPFRFSDALPSSTNFFHHIQDLHVWEIWGDLGSGFSHENHVCWQTFLWFVNFFICELNLTLQAIDLLQLLVVSCLV